ncbi:MAG: hypothetical protein Q7J28_04015 [Caulobacter sp.]|nr:hypothetical protein [Caulobacter sp.]
MNFLRILVIAALLGAASPALAETWVDTRHVTYIDVDSFQRGADGLIYYLEKDKYGDDPTPRQAAVDCVRRIKYSSYDLKFTPDWRSQGKAVVLGTMGEELLDFVCSRVR